MNHGHKTLQLEQVTAPGTLGQWGRTFPLAADFRRRNGEFPRQEFAHPRSAESALATAHAGARAILDGVQRADGDTAMQAVQDFRFGHLLAAADDVLRRI